MKLSNISIIFIIIVLPIILILSYYISLQIDTINMQTSYTTKQLQATREALEAFEINTVQWNEDYSETVDSKRRDIMASINTFTTGFANSLGIGGTNKENILPYIPAIACTLYDGYYIYTPSETKNVIKDKNGVAVFVKQNLVNYGSNSGRPITFSDNEYDSNDEGKLLYEYDSSIEGVSPDGTYNGIEFTLNPDGAKVAYEHILKPFSTYSARYKNGDIDITVNYTLDNYITIYGNVNGEYVVKSGYLINTRNDLVFSKETLTERIWYKGIEEPKFQQGFPYVYADDNTKVYFDGDTTFQVSSTGIRTDLKETTSIKYKKVRENTWDVVYQALNSGDIEKKDEEGKIETIQINQGSLYKDKKGTIAENVQENIGIQEDYSSRNYYIESIGFTKWVEDNLSNIKIGDMQVEDTSIYGDATDKIFDVENTDIEAEDSVINLHKREVIKQTIISNLNQSITSYSRNSQGDYYLPILTETDWDHILRNVSFISFVQGMPIGMKYYNNYAIATSTSNKEYTNPDEIYLTRQGDTYYHLPYCSKLKDDTTIIGYRNIDYVIKSYKTESDTNYYYKHSNIANEACYYCLVQRNLYNSTELSDEELYEHERAYKIALARERYRNITSINIKDKLDYDISVDLNENYEGGSIETIFVSYQGKYGGGIPHGLPSYPTNDRPGYKIKGWFTEPDGGTQITNASTVINQDNHTLYAHWEEKSQYKITFDANGGTVSTNSKIVVEGETYGDLPIPTREGYTFLGWFTGSSQRYGSMEYKDHPWVYLADTLPHITFNSEDEIENYYITSGRILRTSEYMSYDIVDIKSDTTLYAGWTKTKFRVTFDANGGYGLMWGSVLVTNGSECAYLLEEQYKPEREGYTFVGWFAGTAKHDPSKQYKDYPWLYYADANEGLYEAFGYDETELKEHYYIEGGNTQGLRVSEYMPEDAVNFTEDITLYAGWSKNQHTVTLDANGGYNLYVGSIQVTYGEQYGYVLDDNYAPQREGYTFIGWFTGSAKYDPSKQYKDYPWLYYADTYEDLYNAFGYVEEKLKWHYNIQGGPIEKRKISEYCWDDKVKITEDTTFYAGWSPN